MDPHDISIRLQALDGAWEVVGSEALRYRGVWPENEQFTANEWGSDTCSFELRRVPGALHPDLSAFTPAEIWVAGRLCWSGRVKETPTREGADSVISVQGQGWQYHLDDDIYQTAYVHTRLGEYVDFRSFPQAVLGVGGAHAAGQIAADHGITLQWASGSTIVTGAHVGVTLDLGPYSTAKRISIDWTSSNNAFDGTFYARASDGSANSTWSAGQYDDAFLIGLNTGASGTTTGTFATARRYVSLFLYYGGGGGTWDRDVWFTVTGARVFTSTAYESGGQSILRADHVWNDALDQATMLLDTDRSGIEPGEFTGIPDAVLDGLKSPREVIGAFNAYENYETKIDDRRPVFRPRASSPAFEIGEWSGAEFEDASANSGEEILNRVFAQGQQADGSTLTVERWSNADQPGSSRGITQISNPDATVDASGWTVTGSIVRDTDAFVTAPASFRLVSPADGSGLGVMSASAGATVAANRRYRLRVWHRQFNPQIQHTLTLTLTTSPSGTVHTRTWTFKQSGTLSWAPYILDFIAPTGATDNTYTITIRVLRAQPSTTSNLGYIDNVSFTRLEDTLVDRRGFIRSRVLPISNRITEASASRISDLYLEDHRTTPFTGSFKAVGVGGVRRVIGGAAVHPAWLARETGQLVRASHVIDPDTGSVGRDERMTNVQYDHGALTATASLSEDRGGLDALLSRLALVVGN